MTRGGILAVFAHPDDESLLAGGTLAACAEAGIEVTLLCVTRGEAGPIADPQCATRETLGIVRESELMDAAQALGIAHVECLAYPDGALRWSDRASLLADIAERICRVRADAVITFGPEGWYWHRDHIAVHEATVAALALLAEEIAEPQTFFATWPAALAGDMATAMRARGANHDLWGMNTGAFGVPITQITTIVDVRSFVPRKMRALRSHRSQLTPGHLLAGLFGR
ncbi:MAG: PIG-L family deacetylase [Thermomicrobia bacterium]|nr:PIG-L family deacetylase [Thermomicrobia bacterium]